nr:PREDICTED: RNA-binding KH domain-containing protein PEPPER-like [Daucus carota subsp. sativus]
MASYQPTVSTAATTTKPQLDASAAITPSQAPEAQPNEQPKWPGWPGCNVYRLIVPLMKVGSIIGKKGETVKKLWVETGARVNVLPGLVTCPHRVVVISGKEDPDAALSPAMVAVMRLSKQVIGLPEGDEDDIKSSGAAGVNCCVRLLVSSGQGFSLIGRQGARIRPMQEASGAAIRVLSSAEVPTYVIDPDEKVVELEGEAINVLKALKSVVGHLRKFLVDHSVLPLFEKNVSLPLYTSRQTDNADKMMLNPTTQAGLDGSEYSLSVKRDASFVDIERNQDTVPCLSGWPYNGQAAGPPGISSLEVGPINTQVAHITQIPLMYAHGIIGVDGSNIAYIRRYSGAIVTVQESPG